MSNPVAVQRLSPRLARQLSLNNAFSRRLLFFFVLHPLPNKIRAADDAKLSAFSPQQIIERDSVQFLQMRHIEQRPQSTANRRADELIKVK